MDFKLVQLDGYYLQQLGVTDRELKRSLPYPLVVYPTAC